MLNINHSKIEHFDPEIYAAIQNEAQRQEEHIELIASENYASLRVIEAQGSVLTNKYAEGYPKHRYYAGCEHIDTTEQLAINRAKKLFNANYANVQPHSGSQANAATYLAILKPGDTILGMGLTDGGHLTHGSKVNFSGKIYNSIHYGLSTKTEDIDYEQVESLAQQHKPRVIVAGFSAFSRIIDWQKFRDIADASNAILMADMAHVAGLIAAGIYPSPVGIADVITSTTHKTLAGPRGGIILANTNEELNKKLNFSVFPGSQGGPLCHIIAAKAICFKEAMTDAFKDYQIQTRTNAQAMCETLIERGIKIVSNGTDNHMFLINLIGKKYSGKDAEEALDRAHITVNKNTVPNDPATPFITSGLRIGTPAITRRGFSEETARELAGWICDILDNIDNESIIKEIQNKVIALCHQHPVYKQ